MPVTAIADPHYHFTGWSGSGCAGTGQCVVTMDATRSVTATFTEDAYDVTVTVVGSGTVENVPGNPYTYGQTATLTPTL